MKLVRSFVFAGSLATVGFAVMSAGGCSSGPAQGTQGGPCFPNGSCNTGLSCVSNKCEAAEAGPADAGADAKDAGKDTYVPPMDTGPMCPTPMDVTGFMPPNYIPAKTAKACSNAQITGYWMNCLMMGGNCSMFRMNNMACSNCIESRRADPMSPTNDAMFGPMILGNGIIMSNVPGCIELKGDLGCAKARQALNFCTYAACDEICPVMSQADLTNWNKCVTTATSKGCKTYADKTTTDCASEAGMAASAWCTMFSGFQDYYNNYAPLFCGTGD